MDLSRSGRLTVAQQQLALLQREGATPAALNMSYAMRVDGPVNRDALERSMVHVCERHEALRTTYSGESDDLHADVHRKNDLNVGVRFGRRRKEMTEAASLVLQERTTAFDIGCEAPLRLSLYPLTTGQHLLLLTLHHIAADGWSMDLFCRDLTHSYSQALAGNEASHAPLLSQCIDHAAWQQAWLRGTEAADQYEWWAKNLSEANTELLPFTHRNCSADSEIERQAVMLPSALVAELETMRRRAGVSLFAALLTAFYAVLQRHTSSTDLTVGSLVANRPTAASSNVLGAHYNPVLFRVNVSDDPSLSELLFRVSSTTIAALDRQAMPFPLLANELRVRKGVSIEPAVMFLLDRYPCHQLQLSGASVYGLYVSRQPPPPREYDSFLAVTPAVLTFFVREYLGTYTLSALYQGELVHSHLVRELSDAYIATLAALVDSPELSLSEIAFTTDAPTVAGFAPHEWIPPTRSRPELRPVAHLGPAEALSPVTLALTEGIATTGG